MGKLTPAPDADPGRAGPAVPKGSCRAATSAAHGALDKEAGSQVSDPLKRNLFEEVAAPPDAERPEKPALDAG